MGRTCRSLPGLACEGARCPTRQVLSGAAREDTVVLEVPRAAGEVRHEEVRASAIVQGGRIVHVIEVWRDITRRRLEEARLAESYRLASLGMLASGFSHELNTPLQTVLTCLEGMQAALEDPAAEDREFFQESVQIAREQVLRCRAISGQFLRLARGGLAEAEVSDLAVLAEAAVRLARPVAREAGVTLAVENPGTPILVRAAEGPVQLVLLNLLVNAVEASPRGKTVRVAVRTTADGPLCEVADEGPGIPPENLPRIFEPFFSTKARGTGLGLFLAREFARGWGGDIRVERAEGGGARFVVSFRPADPVTEER